MIGTQAQFNAAQRSYDAQEPPSYWEDDPPEQPRPMTDPQKIKLLTLTLEQVRELAWIEAVAGSKAWSKCVSLIDDVTDSLGVPPETQSQPNESPLTDERQP